MAKYKLVLGLEIHLHPKTERKMFCGCTADIYDAKPNTHTCPVCLGFPGELPVPNYDAVEKTQLLGVALHCKLNKNSRFDRKHYFYPDLPMGFQISQYLQPLCGEGYLDLESGQRAEIERIHLEEDTAKSIHEHQVTLIDYNKSGMPLVEIVTKPIFTRIEDAVEFCKQIQEIVRTVGIGDADMEKGQMRLEANISMRTQEMEDAKELPKYKVEIKNINSFRFMEKAVKSEIERQSEMLSQGQKVLQENRGFNEFTGKTVSQREKEEAHDYRYFSDPDIPPMTFDDAHFKEIKSRLPELPYEKVEKYLKAGLSRQEANYLSSFTNREANTVFENLVDQGVDAKKLAKLLVNKPEVIELSADEIKEKLEAPKDQISGETELEEIIKAIITENPNAVADYKKGRTNSIEFMIGQIMRATKGKADIAVVRKLLQRSLDLN